MPVPNERLHLMAGATIVADSVSTTILSWIADGTLQAGERIHDAQVAETLNVSQSAVRAALRSLRDLNIVEIEPNRYSKVAEANPTAFVCAFTTCVALWKHGAAKSLPGLTQADRKAFCNTFRALRERIDNQPNVNPIADPRFSAEFMTALRLLVDDGTNSIMIDFISRLEPMILHFARISSNFFDLDKLKDVIESLERAVHNSDISEVIASLDQLDSNVSDFPERFRRQHDMEYDQTGSK